MFYLPTLLALSGIWILVVMTPGPDFVATVHYSTTRSRRDGILVALGITSALTIWIIGSLVGLEYLMARAAGLVEVIRTLGALYLIYLGIKTITHAHRPISSLDTSPTRGFAVWRVGFLTNLGNPKAAAFFSSLFIVMLPSNPSIWFQTVCVVVMLAIALIWFSIVAWVFSADPIIKVYQRAKRWIEYITGSIFILLGARLALGKR